MKALNFRPFWFSTWTRCRTGHGILVFFALTPWSTSKSKQKQNKKIYSPKTKTNRKRLHSPSRHFKFFKTSFVLFCFCFVLFSRASIVTLNFPSHIHFPNETKDLTIEIKTNWIECFVCCCYAEFIKTKCRILFFFRFSSVLLCFARFRSTYIGHVCILLIFWAKNMSKTRLCSVFHVGVSHIAFSVSHIAFSASHIAFSVSHIALRENTANIALRKQ